MISIFYNTRKKNQSYIEHIKKCSNYDNEIVCFENDGSVSLAESYNQFLFQAKYDIVLFIHDDLVLSKSFDYKLYTAFEQSDYGILGIAGTTNISKNGIWWQNKAMMCGKVWHKHNGKIHVNEYSPEKPDVQQVACIDGLFIGVNRQRIEVGFDERFEGFHFYDIPFCILNSLKNVKIGVLSGLKVIHNSIGEVNESWHNNRAQFEELFSEHLPYYIKPEPYVNNLSCSKNIKASVSIIIPTLENYEVLKKCVQSIKKHTVQVNYEILIADTGSEQETLNKIKRELCNHSTKLFEFNYYHFGKINNEMVKHAQYPYILFCNNDIELLNDGVSKMAEIMSNNKDAGTIGARLHYPNGLIQHGGVSIGLIQNKLMISHTGLKTYYQAEFKRVKDVFANTAAFMMIKKSLFNRIGGFIENNLTAFEDVILNVECVKQKKKNIYCGDVVCIHYESLTRGSSKSFNEAKDMKNILQPYLMNNFKYIQKYVKKFQ